MLIPAFLAAGYRSCRAVLAVSPAPAEEEAPGQALWEETQKGVGPDLRSTGSFRLVRSTVDERRVQVVSARAGRGEASSR